MIFTQEIITVRNKNLGKDFKFLQMVIFTQESMKMIFLKDMVSITGRAEPIIEEILCPE